jgi:hypothetical protein
MRVSAATEPGSPNVPNEDWLGVTPSAIVVLDGVTVPDVMAGGCSHGTPWYVRQLGMWLLDEATAGAPLADALADSISAVAKLHPECDLAAEGAPSAAVGMLRATATEVEYLVLADLTILLETSPGGIKVITDNRVAASVAGVPTSGPDVGDRIAERRAADRNRPGGYWVAAADPEAAAHAVTGTVPASGLVRAAVMTDGASRAGDMFGWPWEAVFRMDAADLITDMRWTEAQDQLCVRWPRFKASDDATVVFWEA